MILLYRVETRGLEKLCGEESHGEIAAMCFKICVLLLRKSINRFDPSAFFFLFLNYILMTM